MSGPEPDPDSVWTRGVFDCDRNVWSRTDEQAGWHGEVSPTVTAGGGIGFTAFTPSRFPTGRTRKGPSTATGRTVPAQPGCPTKAAAMAACEQAGTFTDA